MRWNHLADVRANFPDSRFRTPDSGFKFRVPSFELTGVEFTSRYAAEHSQGSHRRLHSPGEAGKRSPPDNSGRGSQIRLRPVCRDSRFTARIGDATFGLQASEVE
jgi:hypothetical protein